MQAVFNASVFQPSVFMQTRVHASESVSTTCAVHPSVFIPSVFMDESCDVIQRCVHSRRRVAFKCVHSSVTLIQVCSFRVVLLIQVCLGKSCSNTSHPDVPVPASVFQICKCVHASVFMRSVVHGRRSVRCKCVHASVFMQDVGQGS